MSERVGLRRVGRGGVRFREGDGLGREGLGWGKEAGGVCGTEWLKCCGILGAGVVLFSVLSLLLSSRAERVHGSFFYSTCFTCSFYNIMSREMA